MVLLGASLEVVLRSLDLAPGPWSISSWLRSTAFVALSYVAGFIASTPGGLGVREFLLQQFLAPELGARAVVVVLLLLSLLTALTEPCTPPDCPPRISAERPRPESAEHGLSRPGRQPCCCRW